MAGCHRRTSEFNGPAAGLDGSFEDRTGLHFRDFRERDPQAATAMAEHGVEFLKLGETMPDLALIGSESACHLRDILILVRQELPFRSKVQK